MTCVRKKQIDYFGEISVTLLKAIAIAAFFSSAGIGIDKFLLNRTKTKVQEYLVGIWCKFDSI